MRIGDLIAVMTLDDKLSSGLTRAGDNMQKFGSQTMILSGAVAALGGASILAAMQFDKTLTQLTSLAGVASKDLSMVKERILELGPAVGKGPQELVEAMMAISSTTDNTAVALQILTKAAEMSATGMGETKEVGRALTAIVNSYGAENISAAKAADILTQAVKDGGAEATELAGVLSNVIPAAAQMGIEFEQVGAFIATVTQLGTPAAEAVTQLSAVMTAMGKETKEGTAALKSIGMSYEDLRKAAGENLQGALQMVTDKLGGNITALRDVYGREEAFRGAMSATGAQAKTYAKEVNAMANSLGAQSRAHETFEKTAGAAWDKFTASLSVAGIKLGYELIPALTKTLDAMKPIGEVLVRLIKAFGDAPAPVRTLTIAVFGLIAVMGPLAFAVGNVVTAVGTVGGVLITFSNTIPMLTARLWLMEAGVMGVSLALGKLLLAGAVFAGAYFLTQWFAEVTGMQKEIDNLIDKMFGLRDAELALMAEGEKQKALQESLIAARAALARGDEAAAKATAWWMKEMGGLAAGVQKVVAITDKDISAKLKSVKATDDLAKATELYGEKVTDPQLATRIIALADAHERGAKSAEKLRKELDAMDEAFRSEAAAEHAKEMAESFGVLDAAAEELGQVDWDVINQQASIGLGLEGVPDDLLDDKLKAIYGHIPEQITDSVDSDRIDAVLEGLFGTPEKNLGKTKKKFEDFFAALDLPGVIMGAIQGGGDIGEAIGAALGGAGGKALGTAIGGPIGGQIGEIVGTLLGSTIGGIMTDFFGGNKWKETGRIAGRVLGGEVSEELARQIRDTQFEFGVTAGNAALLNLQDFVDETGKSAMEVAPQIRALMTAITSGAVPAAAGLEEINGLFDELVVAANAGDAAARRLTQSLVQQGIAAGHLSASMQSFVQEAVNKMAAGGTKILEGLSLIQSPLGEMGTAAAQSFVAGFTAQIAEVGLVQALVDSGTQIEALFEKLTQEGNTAGAAMLAPFVQLSAAINNEVDPSVRGFLLTLQGMGEVFAGLDQLGFVTQDAFTGLTTGIQGTVNALSEAGIVGPSALLAIAPQLAQVIRANEDYGFAIDENTQALIDQAREAGIAFPTDPIQALIDLVGQLVVLMGGTLPEAVARVAPAAAGASNSIDALGESFSDMALDAVTSVGAVSTALEAIPDNKSVKINVSFVQHGQLNDDGTPDFDNNPTNSFAGGTLGFRNFGSGTPAMLHGEEMVATRDQMDDIIRTALLAGGGGGQPPVSVNVSIPVDASTMPAAHQQQFIESAADAVGRSFLPGGRNYRNIMRAIRSAQVDR